MTPDVYNRLRGQSLTIIAMDIIRAEHGQGRQVSAWSLAKEIAQRYQLTKHQHKQLRSRIYDMVRQLEASKLITCTMHWNREKNVHTKLITPCSDK